MTLTTLIPFWRHHRLPVRRTGEDPFSSMWEEMNRVFSDFDRNFAVSPARGDRAVMSYLPRLDLVDAGKEYSVSVELPGMELKDLDLSLSENVLTIKGEKKIEKENEEKNFFHMERSYGIFERRIELPSDVQTEKVDARFKNGVLTVTLPKLAEPKPETKKINVKGE